MKRIFAFYMVMTLCMISIVGCGEKAVSSQVSTTKAEESQASEKTESKTDGMEQLQAMGDVDVEKNLFNVTLTVPKDFVEDVTQEKLDESVKEKGYKSAVLNEDGSVTYVMTKAQHEELLESIKQSIDNSLSKMIESDNYPNITNVEANDDYTKYTITTKNKEPDLSESFSVMALYVYSGMYSVFNGEEIDNVCVEFVNADTGEVIKTANSKDMNKKG